MSLIMLSVTTQYTVQPLILVMSLSNFLTCQNIFQTRNDNFHFQNSINIWLYEGKGELFLPPLKIGWKQWLSFFIPGQQTQLWFGSEVNGDGGIWEGSEVKHVGKNTHESREHIQEPKWLLLCHSNINKCSHSHWPLCNSSAYKEVIEVQRDANKVVHPL